ncbi:AMP-binding protein [Streptomyces mirabilis]|nr:AMP-binding protein [Streptomyces mirabilis]
MVDGELHLLGDNLARGYRGDRPPDTSRFAPLAQLAGAPRAYRTGDLVRIGDDGQLRYLGRSDTEFKISGHRVHPAEVEGALLGHPGVRGAAVVGQVLGEGRGAWSRTSSRTGPPRRWRGSATTSGRRCRGDDPVGRRVP